MFDIVQRYFSGAIGAVVAFIVLVIAVLILSSLKSTPAVSSDPIANETVTNSLSFFQGLTAQLGLAGTIAGLFLLVVIIAGLGALGYFAYNRVRGGSM